MAREGVLQVDVSGRNLQASVSEEYCKLAHGGVLQVDVSGRNIQAGVSGGILQVGVSGEFCKLT